MKDSTRHRSHRKGRPAPEKETRVEQPSEARVKPLNHNDLVKWIVISDAPDHASVDAKFRDAKGYPVLPRSPKYLDRFSARDLRIGLKCLRAMTDSAREENEKLEQEALALGCVHGEVADVEQLDVESKKSRIACLGFGLAFYRSKVLPFIQACLIAEGQLQSLPPGAPAALSFPGSTQDAFSSLQQVGAAKAAYDVAYASGLPQEACETAARRSLGPLNNSHDPVEPATDKQGSVTPGRYQNNHEYGSGSQTQTPTSAPAADATASPSPSSSPLPPTPRAPDFSSSPAVATTPLKRPVPDAMDVEEEATTSSATPRSERNHAALSALPFFTSSPAPRRSARSTRASMGVGAGAGAGAGASEIEAPTPPSLQRVSVWEMQREILRLCALRERCTARNAVLKEWVTGVRGEGEGG